MRMETVFYLQQKMKKVYSIIMKYQMNFFINKMQEEKQ